MKALTFIFLISASTALAQSKETVINCENTNPKFGFKLVWSQERGYFGGWMHSKDNSLHNGGYFYTRCEKVNIPVTNLDDKPVESQPQNKDNQGSNSLTEGPVIAWTCKVLDPSFGTPERVKITQEKEDLFAYVMQTEDSGLRAKFACKDRTSTHE